MLSLAAANFKIWVKNYANLEGQVLLGIGREDLPAYHVGRVKKSRRWLNQPI